MTRFCCLLICLLCLGGCAPATPAPTLALPASATPVRPTLPPTASPTLPGVVTTTPLLRATNTSPALTPSPTATTLPSATADTRLTPEAWQEWPVIPALSARAKALYASGLAQGNNPHAFSKVGDCQNINSHFLAAFDDPQLHILGPRFEYLAPAIAQFRGMFARESAAVRNGFNVAAVLSPLQADPDVCKAGETPLACELRLNKPSIVLISMETWWAKKPADEYAKYMRQIIDTVIAARALPVLATKADNLEGDGSINLALARIAYEYDIPLWNFWKAVQPLPGGGLVEDGFHLSRDGNDPADPLFYRRLSDPKAWEYGWPVRNVTALQAMDAVWRAASAP